MRTAKEFALIKFQSELLELAHACSKILEFGEGSCHPDTGESNLDAFRREYIDLLVSAAVLATQDKGYDKIINVDRCDDPAGYLQTMHRTAERKIFWWNKAFENDLVDTPLSNPGEGK